MVLCGAQREQGEQYIDRRRRAVQWTDRFAPKLAPIRSHVKYGATAPPFQMPVCLQFGTERGGKRARAWRIENSPTGGPRHENAFLRVKGKKRFGVTAGSPYRLAAIKAGKNCRLHNDLTCAFNSGMFRKTTYVIETI